MGSVGQASPPSSDLPQPTGHAAESEAESWLCCALIGHALGQSLAFLVPVARAVTWARGVTYLPPGLLGGQTGLTAPELSAARSRRPAGRRPGGCGFRSGPASYQTRVCGLPKQGQGRGRPRGGLA